ncbi:hypothetical protein SAMN05216404_11225 [Nitrosospira multiformis]|uniref:Uncharacterized protein n=1 Tax=Nitrosospira multiformis TaxID=1231 RepID=A0A1H8M749_9PROT|nr:hypothetical protein [Nitrosospira multiformis]SEO13145.1 hypothetical protein SAMN05216404_11225 [Nitrosospira multiformis]
MSEKQSNKQQLEPLTLKEQAGNLPEPSRRRLLKGTVAVPIIMTLHSGAALARTSNLVGPTEDINSAMKENGDLYCVHPSSDGSANTIPVDLGTSPTATINPITDANGAPDLQAQATACRNGGGILVSATAWSSVGPKLSSISTITT